MLVKKGEVDVIQFTKVLDQHLADRTWVAQDALTLADLAISTPLMMIGPAKLPVGDFANVRAWLGRVQELDAWKKTSL